MSSSGSGDPRDKRAAAAEQHLGDRLAAFVDGELADDARDRVQAHLATCPQCKAAATEQRRLKSAVAASELPAIPSGLLARLQGLAACGPDGPQGPGGDPKGGSPGLADLRALPGPGDGPGPFDSRLLGSDVFGTGTRRRPSYLSPGRDLVAPGEGKGARGFRIHETARGLTGGADRVPLDVPVRPQAAPRGGTAAAAAQASFSRRFAFAAAGAFSMAAIALGGALPMEAGVDNGAHPDDGPAVTPFSANSVTDTHGTTPRDLLDAREQRTMRQARVAPSPSAVVTPGSVPSVTTVALRAAAAVSATPATAPGGPAAVR
ncbi:anti-sigma factor family protein [Streptomyces sp. NPDC021020]|uniref:anti-sigma factor family protein n=1 Tax=Streptomyces sp. NPDC021020 TaxID=3365109 RepID=UPI0037A89ED0